MFGSQIDWGFSIHTGNPIGIIVNRILGAESEKVKEGKEWDLPIQASRKIKVATVKVTLFLNLNWPGYSEMTTNSTCFNMSSLYTKLRLYSSDFHSPHNISYHTIAVKSILL